MSEKEHVARNSAIAGGTLALLKLGVGLMTGSLALISEGVHSSLDFGVTLVTWFSVKTADVPADEKHHYGHGKLENLSAFAQAMLLLMTAFWILKESFGRISESLNMQTQEIHGNNGGWFVGIAVIGVSFFVDLQRSIALSRAAKKFKSQALEADAMHFGTELMSSGVVFAGLLLVTIGGQRFAWADPMAAIVVAAVMMFTSMRLGKRAADVLIDSAPPGLEDQIKNAVAKVPGVRDVVRIRARQSGARSFVDATITLDANLTLAASHDISDAVELRVTETFPDVDILVHVEPATVVGEDRNAVIHEVAKSLGIRLHAIRTREIGGAFYVNFHAEFPGDLTLAAAHAQVTALEQKIQLRLPEILEIDSHIEPIRT